MLDVNSKREILYRGVGSEAWNGLNGDVAMENGLNGDVAMENGLNGDVPMETGVGRETKVPRLQLNGLVSSVA